MLRVDRIVAVKPGDPAQMRDDNDRESGRPSALVYWRSSSAKAPNELHRAIKETHHEFDRRLL